MNFNFYAEKEDRKVILDFIFNETNWEIYDLYSQYGEKIEKYTTTEEVEKKIETEKRSAHFNIYSPDFGGEVILKKINLNPNACNGHTFRYSSEGWGLIQLYFGKVWNARLEYSTIMHNSETRARNWYPTCPDMGNPDLWNWKEVSKASRKLSNFIKKASSLKIGSQYVMPQAEKETELKDIDGYKFLYTKEEQRRE
ncbi:hypothetical protein D0T84_07005 [Dysgonomonas sp. 521]|uniref:hypothetical protein n=1 Tax=Dysgonomonas sp. 521 TaxID=2302932 RepID=UPI0013D8BFD2|nr:hypothetical protein [Dysgonomonas sp. 521]NDV94667.1 hypothetical protein [Dysgonomonas sp. 521]